MNDAFFCGGVSAEKAEQSGGFFMRKIIIDCDPGIDDSLALMLALSSPELDIMGSPRFPATFRRIWGPGTPGRY